MDYVKLYKSLLRQAKISYWQNKFEATKNDMKLTWDNINAVLGKVKSKTNFPDNFTTKKGKIISEPTEIAHEFNEIYTNIGPDLANKIAPTSGNASDCLSSNFPSSLYLEPTNRLEIINIIKCLKPKSSSGYDDISPKLLKHCCQALAEPLSHIANLSIEAGIFPSLMKIAKVIPLYKKDSKSDFLNYRPISLLPSFSKIIEKLIHKRLMNYLTQHNILSPSQYGFRPNMSTELAILELQNRIVTVLAAKQYCLGLFIDLSKAFDTLNHRILIKKLQSIGIRGTPLRWFQSYLSERQQYVSFKATNSTKLKITCGVPQGSILGPLLFLIYINDLEKSLSKSRPILFADDTTILISNRNYNKLIEDTNKEIEKLHNWFSVNKLSLNISKTNYVIFHSVNRNIPIAGPTVKIGNTAVSKVPNTKFLGVHLDSNLNWKVHIRNKSTQVLKIIAILARLKHTLSLNTLRTIYTSLILPHLNYAIPVWGNVKNSEIKRLNILQKKAVRHITNSKYNSHTSPLFKKLKLLTLTDIFNNSCCQCYFKLQKDTSHPYFHEQLLTNNTIHNYFTRHSNDIHRNNITSALEKQSLNFKISKIWNNLPSTLRQNITASQHIFNKRLKQHFISQYQEICTIPNCKICSRGLQ